MKFVLFVALALLAACGSFPLGTYKSATRTQDQGQLDSLTCTHEADVAANTSGRVVGAFFLGLTIIGTPVAFAMERAKEREVYAACMTAKGYTVTPP